MLRKQRYFLKTRTCTCFAHPAKSPKIGYFENCPNCEVDLLLILYALSSKPWRLDWSRTILCILNIAVTSDKIRAMINAYVRPNLSGIIFFNGNVSLSFNFSHSSQRAKKQEQQKWTPFYERCQRWRIRHYLLICLLVSLMATFNLTCATIRQMTRADVIYA